MRASRCRMNSHEPYTADEWYANERRARVEELQRQARRLYGQSSLWFDIGDPQAESVARRMLGVAASAFWNAEDTELESSTHSEMDSYGAWVRRTFGCHLAYDSGTYYQRCPVAIAHKRIGMSVGFTVRRRICSICSEDWSDCIHSPNELYDVPGGPNQEGYCRVCGIEDCTKHRPEQTYRMPPIAIVTEVEQLNEISLVPKPAQPDARLTSLPVDTESLRAALGASFSPGMPVSCDRCLGPCGGIEEFPS
jgi:hypothetical protein